MCKGSRIKRIIESPFSCEVVEEEVCGHDLKETFLDDLENRTHDARKERGNRVNSKFSKLNPKTWTASFESVDPGGSGKTWRQDIRFPEFTQIGRYSKDFEGTEEKIALALKAGEVLVYCNCPDFIYKGFKYMGHVSDWGIRKETRPPEIMNPTLEGALCKHLYSIVDDIDNFIPTVANAFDRAKDQDYTVVRSSDLD